eukprot:CAMPEP_0181452692 /NCGR_PEP_ID=MMETSP1110-20121109/29337_1 /TAXON_ID=174948 /ORGANISM="Symbiodinium sp., Strain CCMP421" /LENGTH=140 /DNA_ID=CAMNT_0023576981 /DNA_START=52 /DNA_END=474 /DNA_ORIENTATION=-
MAQPTRGRRSLRKGGAELEGVNFMSHMLNSAHANMTKAVEEFMAQEVEKYDLVFAILRDLQKKQNKLETVVASLQAQWQQQMWALQQANSSEQIEAVPVYMVDADGKLVATGMSVPKSQCGMQCVPSQVPSSESAESCTD